jgi:hypothetical protein
MGGNTWRSLPAAREIRKRRRAGLTLRLHCRNEDGFGAKWGDFKRVPERKLFAFVAAFVENQCNVIGFI